jgi:multimeric flavodoxin WrbA
MKQILGIICSPRKLGNNEIAVKEISRRIKEPHTLKLLRLSDFNIKLCKGCYLCLFKSHCVLKDDLPVIIDAFCHADAFIVSAPAYCLGANASLKVLADRVLAFSGHVKEIWGKPAVGLSIAGLEGKEGFTKLNVDSFMRLFLMNVKASQILYAALPGEVCVKEENLNILDRLTSALMGEPVEPEEPRCPLCKGDTFRFLGNNRVRCMLCSNEGTVEAADGSIRIHAQRSDHELFLSEKDATDHGAWLAGMKSKYQENKTDLKAMTAAYKDIGEWIKPIREKKE